MYQFQPFFLSIAIFVEAQLRASDFRCEDQRVSGFMFDCPYEDA